MKRLLLSMTVVAAMVAVSGLALQQQPTSLWLTWVNKASAETPPVAVLIEMGLQDAKPRDWSGRAAVQGATVAKRAGYRFRSEDQLVEPDRWKVASHRALRAPQRR